jgi:signal peptidase II
MKKTRKLNFVLLAVVLLVIDQLTKLAIRAMVPPNSSVPVFGNIFTLTFVQNTGAVFGSLKGFNGIFIWTTIMAIGLILLVWDSFPRNYPTGLFLTLILTGSLGNLIDRIFLGYVTDFANFGFWPVFNVADSLVSIGVVGIVVMLAKESFADEGRNGKDGKKAVRHIRR